MWTCSNINNPESGRGLGVSLIINDFAGGYGQYGIGSSILHINKKI